MSSLAAWAASALVAAPFAFHGVAYVRAAAAKRRARRACPFDDDDHDTLPPMRGLQLVAAESALWLYSVGTAVRPPAPFCRGTRLPPVVVLVPAGLPRAAARLLVGRLVADGFSVACRRLGGPGMSQARRLARLDEALRTFWELSGARTVDVIAIAGAATDAAAHLAAGGSGVPAVRRLLTLGAAGAAGSPVPAATETIAFYSADDPLLGSLEAARRPEALNVVMRGLGRLGMLHAPHAYALVREHLEAPPVDR